MFTLYEVYASGREVRVVGGTLQEVKDAVGSSVTWTRQNDILSVLSQSGKPIYRIKEG